MGFISPSAHIGNQGPRSAHRPVRVSVLTPNSSSELESTDSSHAVGYGAALRLSQPLSGLVPLATLLPVFRQVTLLGFRPPGAYAFHEAPLTRHQRHTLLTLLPRVARPLSQAEDPLGTLAEHLGQRGRASFSSSGPSSSRKSAVTKKQY